ncbi:kinase-like domain-containing protein [Rhizoctonia solani]|nr:kinase-like domain-containing protein [Rhizoctonia solani]
MIPEAPLVFLRHPMVTRSTAWLCRLPTNHPVVSRRPTVGDKTKSYIHVSRFGTSSILDLPQSSLLDTPVTRYLHTRTERDLSGIYVLDPYHCGLGANTGSYHEHKLSQSDFTTPILGCVERQLQDIRRAHSLPNLNNSIEHVECPVQLWDTMTYGAKSINYNATITRLGQALTQVAHSTYTNLGVLNKAFQSITIRLRGGIGLYRALSRDSWKLGESSFQQRWVDFGPFVDEPRMIEPCTIGSTMTIAETTSILMRHCCKNLGRLLSLRSCSSHPVSTGGFGDIYLGRLENGVTVAIKVARYSTNHVQSRKQSKHAAKELHTWAKCQHPNVLPLLGMAEFQDQIAMVSPWMKNGDLRSYLRQHPEVERCQLCYDICDGLVYLHSMNIIHGDLKGANVLISEDGKAMLSDFGNSLVEDNTIRFTATTRDVACSSRWAAPEILDGAAASYPADIFALGMTLLEAITGDVPYRELGREQAVIATILVKKAIPVRPTAHIPQNSAHGDILWDLLTRCWTYEPPNRPPAEEVQSLMILITKKGLMQQS